MATEVKQRNGRVLVVVGAVLALATFALVFYVSRNGGGSSGSSATVSVVVAKTDLTQGSPLTQDNLTTAQFPASAIPAGAQPSVQGFLSPQQFTSVAVSKNEIITPNVLVKSATAAATTALQTAPLAVDKDKVAIAIPTNQGGINHDTSADLATVGNNIQAGDHVDMILGTTSGVKYGFQDIQVLQVGLKGAAGGASPGVLVVQVTRAQAEELVFLFSKHFILNPDGSTKEDKTLPVFMTFVLRNHDQRGVLPATDKSVPQTSDAPVDSNTFNSLFGLH